MDPVTRSKDSSKPENYHDPRYLSRKKTMDSPRSYNSYLKYKIMKKNSTLVPPYPSQGSHQGSLAIYQICTSISNFGVIRKRQLGTAKPGSKEKVIMMVGATGSGKTTMIDAMFNYVVDVKLEDPFRFKLVDESVIQAKESQAHSQTNDITAYTLHYQNGFAVPYTLTIVDTPGFGDTRGKEHDKKLVGNIREFFTAAGDAGIDHIDAVGFVVKATDSRLTEPQKYIFDSVLSIWGKNIKGNIFMFFSFADQNPPAVSAALDSAKIPYEKQKCLKINNSALFGEGKTEFENMFLGLYWKMNAEGFQQFLMHLTETEAKSLTLSQAVLGLREELEACGNGNIEDIQNIIVEQDKLNVPFENLEKEKLKMCQEKNKQDWNEENIRGLEAQKGSLEAKLVKLEKKHKSILSQSAITEDNQEDEFQLIMAMLNRSETMIYEEKDRKKNTLDSNIIEQNNLEAQLAGVKKQETDLEGNNDFITEEIIQELNKVPVESKKSINCSKCERTCHYPCKAILKAYFCSIVRIGGECKVCFCSYKEHYIQDFKYERERKTIQKTDETLESQHDQTLEELRMRADEIEERLRELRIRNDRIRQQLNELEHKAHHITDQQIEIKQFANEYRRPPNKETLGYIAKELKELETERNANESEQRRKEREQIEKQQEEMRSKAIAERKQIEKQQEEMRSKTIADIEKEKEELEMELVEIETELEEKRMLAIEIAKQQKKMRQKNEAILLNLQEQEQDIKKKLEAYQKNCFGLVMVKRLIIETLQEIALQPMDKTAGEKKRDHTIYIETLILFEKKEEDEGWERRSQQLQELQRSMSLDKTACVEELQNIQQMMQTAEKEKMDGWKERTEYLQEVQKSLPLSLVKMERRKMHDYIQQMMKTEEKEAKEGWGERIKPLKEFQESLSLEIMTGWEELDYIEQMRQTEIKEGSKGWRERIQQLQGLQKKYLDKTAGWKECGYMVQMIQTEEKERKGGWQKCKKKLQELLLKSEKLSHEWNKVLDRINPVYKYDPKLSKDDNGMCEKWKKILAFKKKVQEENNKVVQKQGNVYTIQESSKSDTKIPLGPK